MDYEVVLWNGTVLTYEATSGNDAMNQAIQKEHITYDDIDTVKQK